MNRFYSLFSQIRKSIPRTDFEGVMRHLKAERHARGVSCWQQFVPMLFCQLGRPHGLRETEGAAQLRYDFRLFAEKCG